MSSAMILISRVTQTHNKPRGVLQVCRFWVQLRWRSNSWNPKSRWGKPICSEMGIFRILNESIWSWNCTQHWRWFFPNWKINTKLIATPLQITKTSNEVQKNDRISASYRVVSRWIDCTSHVMYSVFNLLFFLKNVSLLCPFRVLAVSTCPKKIKMLDTSFGVSDTDFRVSVSNTQHASSVACSCFRGKNIFHLLTFIHSISSLSL